MQAAYLALTQFLDHNHELVLLLVNTLLSDLKNDNYIIGEALLQGCTSPQAHLRCLPPLLSSDGCHSPGTQRPCTTSWVHHMRAPHVCLQHCAQLGHTHILLHARATTALVVCTKLIGPELINAVYPVVVDRLRHPKEHVRKKAVMALQRFHQLDPTRTGALVGVDVDKHFRTMLCDKVGPRARLVRMRVGHARMGVVYVQQQYAVWAGPQWDEGHKG